MMFVYGVTLSVFPHRAILTAAGIEPRTFGMLSQCLRGKECSIHQLLWVYIENFNMQKQKLALLNMAGNVRQSLYYSCIPRRFLSRLIIDQYGAVILL